MAHKLILEKGAERQVHEFGDIEAAFNAAEPWIRKGYIARITDKQGVIKYTQVLADGQIATHTGNAAVPTQGTTPRNGAPLWLTLLLFGVSLLVAEAWSQHDRLSPEDFRKRIGWGQASDPSQAPYHLFKGRTALGQGKLDEAINSLTEAIGKDPNCAEAYHLRGIAFSKKGDQVRALADREEAVRLNPALAKEAPR